MLKRLRGQQENIIKLVKAGRIRFEDGEADLKSLDAQIAEQERQLSAQGKVIELAPVEQLKQQMAKIYNPLNEPQTYEERRHVLEGLRDLKMSYCDGDLEISGQVPVVAAPSSGEKNCYKRFPADADRKQQHRSRREEGALFQKPKTEAKVPKKLAHDFFRIPWRTLRSLR
jgi:uncharacterized protein with von Willebrand factor type A (vWA) domain